MGSRRRASNTRRSSINYWRLPLDEQQIFDPDAFLTKEYSANPRAKGSNEADSRSPEKGITTPQLVLALRGVLNLVGQTERSHVKQSFENHAISHKANTVCFGIDQTKHRSTSSCAGSLGECVGSSNYSLTSKIYNDLYSVKKMLILGSSSSIIGSSTYWRLVRVVDKLGNICSFKLDGTYSTRTEKIENVEMTRTCESPSGRISMEAHACLIDLDNKEHHYSGKDDGCASRMNNDPTVLSNNPSEEGGNLENPHQNALHDTNCNLEMVHQDCCSPTSFYSSQHLTTAKEAIIISENKISGTGCTNAQLEQSTSPYYVEDEPFIENSANKDQYAYTNNFYQQHAVEESRPSLQHQFHSAIAMNRHAVAGGLAGVLVSLCLHPVDTMKTIIQANSCRHNSFYEILRRTVNERGMLGFYSGIASKITSSAPISAIYTFTYESVKGALLPALPKEQHSIAHCIAGGCSSIATSFVFTPSECIKQHMQVGSQYQNCWKALIGCLQRGGLTSLYAGWGAVLCRNIPHSIVKFYTYESLKQFMLKSAAANAKLNPWQTIVCGGLAGSTAALFTTPFDVVKTRIQLQALNPVGHYGGVLHVLKEIAKQEGLQGLYRGLTPRLAMYISQGAIFFASYEFLKTMLCLEEKPHAGVIDKEKKEDDAAPLTLQKLHS